MSTDDVVALRAEVEAMKREGARDYQVRRLTLTLQERDAEVRRLKEGWKLETKRLDDAAERYRQKDAEVRSLREAVQTAYGFLWCVNSELGTPHRYSAERAAYEARKVLRDLLTHEQIGAGINAAVAIVRKGDEA